MLGTDLTRRWWPPASAGGANVEAQTGEAVSELVGQWQLANYLDDLPGFTEPHRDRLRYKSWNFRGGGCDSKPDLPFPLVPDSTSGVDYTHSGVLAGRLRSPHPGGAGRLARPPSTYGSPPRRATALPADGRSPDRPGPDSVKRMVFFVVVAALFAGYGTAYLASDDVRYVTRAGLRGDPNSPVPSADRRLVGGPHIDPALRHSLAPGARDP